VAALAFGFVAVVVLSLATDEVLHLLKVYPPWNQPMYDAGLCLLATLIATSARSGKLHCGSVLAARADGPRFDFRGTARVQRADRYHRCTGAGVVSDCDCGYCFAVRVAMGFVPESRDAPSGAHLYGAFAARLKGCGKSPKHDFRDQSTIKEWTAKRCAAKIAFPQALKPCLKTAAGYDAAGNMHPTGISWQANERE
jgi:hypothetical protein